MPKSAKKSASKANSSPAAAVAQQTKATKNVKGKRDAEKIIEKKVVNIKKQKTANGGVPRAVENKKAKAQKKKIKKQESSSSESEEEEEKEEPTKPADVATDGAVAAKMDSEDESESDGSGSSDEEDAKPASEVQAAAKPVAEVEEESSDDEEANSDSEEGSDEEDDSSEEEDEPKTAKKKGADAEMVDAPSAKKASQTPATLQATGSKTLFMGNLSFSIEESDVKKFFKDAGEVLEIRFAMRDERFAGYGHVEFATPDAAQKALKLNGELLLDRAVKLDLAKERGAYTPSNGNERSSQKSGQSQGLTVFVRGFGTDDGFDGIRSTLEEHFGSCGEIARMSIPKDFESGDPKGVAFIDFTDSKAFNKALELSGSEVSGGTITVEEAKQRDGGGSGRGRGGRSGGRDGGRNGGRGRSGGRGRFGDRDGGRGRGRGGRRGRGF